MYLCSQIVENISNKREALDQEKVNTEERIRELELLIEVIDKELSEDENPSTTVNNNIDNSDENIENTEVEQEVENVEEIAEVSN